jgi:uncharacterized protein (TIGR02266 family)
VRVVERERRAHPRKLVSTGVSFNDLEGATLRGWLHDISRGGCFVATPSLFTFGEELTIVMTLPFPRQRVQGRVRVAWIREKNDKDNPAGMGLEFIEVNEDALVAIDKLPATAKLSRPKTVIGIAPPAIGSSPSYSDVKLPAHEDEPPKSDAKPAESEAVQKLDLEAGLTEPEGHPIVTVPEPEPVATEPTKPPEMETEEPASFMPALGPALVAAEPEPKKGGREKLIIGGAAAVSVVGLVALIAVYTHHGASTAADAAASASVSSAIPTASAPPAVSDVASTTVPVITPPPPPIVDASVAEAAAPDAGPRDAGADGGKKGKPKPKVKRK